MNNMNKIKQFSYSTIFSALVIAQSAAFADTNEQLTTKVNTHTAEITRLDDKIDNEVKRLDNKIGSGQQFSQMHIDSNSERITRLENTTPTGGDYTAQVIQNGEQINLNTEQMNSNTDQINLNTDQVNSNTDQVNSNTEQVNSNTGRINQNAKNINILNGNINTGATNAKLWYDDNGGKIEHNRLNIIDNATQTDENKKASENNKAGIDTLNSRVQINNDYNKEQDDKATANKLASKDNTDRIAVLENLSVGTGDANNEQVIKNASDIRKNTDIITDNITGIGHNADAINNLSNAAIEHDDKHEEDIRVLTETMSDHDIKHTEDITALENKDTVHSEDIALAQSGVKTNAGNVRSNKELIDSNAVTQGNRINNLSQTVVDNDRKQNDNFAYVYNETKKIKNELVSANAQIDENVNVIRNNTTAINDNRDSVNEVRTIANNNHDSINSNTNAISDNRDSVSEVRSIANNNYNSINSNTNAISDNSGRIQTNHKTAMQGIAVSMATKVILPDPGKKFRVNMGMASFNGESAIGITGAGRLNNSTALYFGLGTDLKGNNTGTQAGVSYQW